MRSTAMRFETATRLSQKRSLELGVRSKPEQRQTTRLLHANRRSGFACALNPATSSIAGLVPVARCLQGERQRIVNDQSGFRPTLNPLDGSGQYGIFALPNAVFPRLKQLKSKRLRRFSRADGIDFTARPNENLCGCTPASQERFFKKNPTPD